MKAFHKTEHSIGIPPTRPSNFIPLMDFPTMLLGDQDIFLTKDTEHINRVDFFSPKSICLLQMWLPWNVFFYDDTCDTGHADIGVRSCSELYHHLVLPLYEHGGGEGYGVLFLPGKKACILLLFYSILELQVRGEKYSTRVRDYWERDVSQHFLKFTLASSF